MLFLALGLTTFVQRSSACTMFTITKNQLLIKTALDHLIANYASTYDNNNILKIIRESEGVYKIYVTPEELVKYSMSVAPGSCEITINSAEVIQEASM